MSRILFAIIKQV